MKMPKSLDHEVPSKYAARYAGYRRKFPPARGLPDGAHMFEFPHTWDGLAELRGFLRDAPKARSLYSDTAYVDVGDKGEGAPAQTERGYVL